MRTYKKYALAAIGILAAAPMLAEIASRSAPGVDDSAQTAREQPGDRTASAPAHTAATAATATASAPMTYSPIPPAGDGAMATGGVDPKPMMDPAAPTAATFNTAPTLTPPEDAPMSARTSVPSASSSAAETPTVAVRANN